VEFRRRVSPLERELADYLGAGWTVEEAREALGARAAQNPAGMASTTSMHQGDRSCLSRTSSHRRAAPPVQPNAATSASIGIAGTR
jgi:hypothetical protein